MRMVKAHVKIFGHPTIDSNGAPISESPLVAEFETQGMGWFGYEHRLKDAGIEPEGVRLFATTIDYTEMGWPSRNYPHTVIVDRFEVDLRRGNYFSCPYGGRIEITGE